MEALIPSPRQLQSFLNSDPDRGLLRVQVSIAAGAFPLSQALVEVAAMLDGGRILLYRQRADQSGIVDDLVLPAKPLYTSQSPATAGDSASHYLVSVSYPGYESITDLSAEVFIGTKTILPVVLTPVTM